MRQHITEEQLNELSDSANKKLRLWVYKKTYEPPEVSNDESMLLSIGQMIEFLDEKRKTILFITKLECGHDNFVWSTGSMSCMGNHTQDKTESKRLHEAGKELCDALWEAVKEVLQS